MKKDLVFLAGLLFLLAVEIFVLVDEWRRGSPLPPAAVAARADGPSAR